MKHPLCARSLNKADNFAALVAMGVGVAVEDR